MITRDELFQQFVSKWVDAEYLPRTVNPRPFDEAEKLLGAFPSAYREFILKFGWVTPKQSLVRAAIASKAFIEPVCEFIAPMDLFSETQSLRSIGLKRGFVPIASNGGGDYFCMKPSPNESSRRDDGTLYLFLHEDASLQKVAKSFQEWIRAYVNIG